MLKEKQLNDDLTSYKCSNNIYTAEEAVNMIEQVAAQNEIPLNIVKDTLKIGGLFKSREAECLVLSHPGHERDYYKIVVMSGVNNDIMMATTGMSKQMKKFAIAESEKAERRGKSMSYKIGHMVGTSIWLLGKSKNKLEAEQDYYDAVVQVVANVFCFE